ncbi:MAG: FAD/NAD(P)-binding protein [Candidatus Hadarchaeum sp.]|uniref:FAD/NAD(P)-binding protein n=1 Tax=Candidatus Hadarchaeum sp. TaxID=2883567 RepID=UPI003D0AAE2B
MTIYKPEIALIKRVEVLTETERLFDLEMLSGKRLDHRPGQFVELSIFGVGEAPISISSAPSEDPTFQLCVRKIGNVTTAMHAKKPGDKVGIRGPFGNGFDLNDFKGWDVLLIGAGLGLAPLRSLIWAVLNSRQDFGRVYIIHGARSPSLLLFKDELKEWEKRTDVEFYSTVDVADETWRGNVGVISTIIPQVNFDPENTQAVIVGPPVVYKFVIKELKNRGMADKNIWVDLERKMKCGVGKCGHCQINNLYVCQDGPVFRYDRIRNLPEAI